MAPEMAACEVAGRLLETFKKADHEPSSKAHLLIALRGRLFVTGSDKFRRPAKRALDRHRLGAPSGLWRAARARRRRAQPRRQGPSGAGRGPGPHRERPRAFPPSQRRLSDPQDPISNKSCDGRLAMTLAKEPTGVLAWCFCFWLYRNPAER